MTASPVAILGAGTVGQALAERLLASGLTVRFGARNPQEVRAKLLTSLTETPSFLPHEAAAPCGVVLLAVPAAAALDAARSLGNLEGKILVDCTNPLRWDNGPVWAPPPEGSVTAALEAALPAASVIKGFNHFGAEIQRNPELSSGPADAYFAGDDPEAKTQAMELAQQMGFRPYDAGPLRNAATLENLAVLWIHLATVGGIGRDFGFRMESLRSNLPSKE